MKWHSIIFQNWVKRKVNMIENVILFAQTIVKKHENILNKNLALVKDYKTKHKGMYNTT